jgi:hypothetical protein
MNLMLLLAMIAQPPTRTDLAFQDSVERFVLAAKPHSVPPEPFYDLIELLGDQCFKCRERASKDILEASKSDLRWLMWGTRHRDPEIRLRCMAILVSATKCGRCDGEGLCRKYVKGNAGDEFMCANCDRSRRYGHNDGNLGECRECRGRGHIWNKDKAE